MARFRSGTLERSVKRFGRFPKFGKFQKVQHGWKYVTLEDQSVNVNGTLQDIVIVSADDWVLAGTASGVKNMVVDLDVALTWTPETAGLGTTFDSWSLKYGLFCMDVDDTGAGIDTVFASTRALKWGMRAFNTKNITSVGTHIDGMSRSWNFKVRARQRFMKFDEELRLMAHSQSDISAVVSDLRLWIFGRVSWEIP